MDHRRLGRTGLEISALCLGCLSFGQPDRGGYPWSLPEAESRPLIEAALGAGINFFDTANAYSLGTSESFLGRALAGVARREEIVVATKLWAPMRRGPNGGGLSRKAILHEIDASLRRLSMDYVDLYQIHRWDPHTPIEETMEALHDVVRSGRARYLGASSMWAWQFAKAQHVAAQRGWTPFVTMQDQYSLLAREVEREMLPLCLDQGVGVLPWSPLARGVLARAWDHRTIRLQSDTFAARAYRSTDASIVDVVGQIATERGCTRSQVALAWVRRHPAVAAPVIGITNAAQLSEAVESLQLELTDAEAARLERHYTPRDVLFS